MANCDCGEPVYIKKTGECKKCYNRNYRARALTRAVIAGEFCDCGDPAFIKKTGECLRCYGKRRESENREYRNEQRRLRRRERRREAREAAKDIRPFLEVLLDQSEQAFASRERALEKRRAWNALNADKRREYRQRAGDPTKRERTARARDRRQAETGYRTPLSQREWSRTPEQAQKRAEYRQRYYEENREVILARKKTWAQSPEGREYVRAWRRRNRERLNEYERARRRASKSAIAAAKQEGGAA